MSPCTPLLAHFLATLAYRTQKALRGAPESFATFDAGYGLRTPQQLMRHINGVLHYALGVLQTGNAGYRSRLETLPFDAEVSRFYAVLHQLDRVLQTQQVTTEQQQRFLQGPLSDAMTHVGQLAMLRRLAGAPVAAENFYNAAVQSGQLGPDQPAPVDPD